jgi:6-phosphogluconolactonase (cycloisomerase 2 family)
MRKLTGLGVTTGAALGLAALMAPAAAGADGNGGVWNPGGGDHVVFVQTDNTSGNQVVAYNRAANGTLTWQHTYATGGLGGVLTGSVVDHLASQGSLTYDQRNNLLYAVNAGSNTVSVFSVWGDQLTLRQVVNSGGSFPVSVAVHGNLVYVVNAENGGTVQGYVVANGHLVPLPGSARPLGLNAAATPQFTNTPGQVAFSPNGSQLIVTTKANGSDIDVYGVDYRGYLSPAPVVNAEPGAVPFGVTFDQAGHLVVAESSSTTPAVATFALNPNGTVTQLALVPTGQAATCWIAPAGGFFYASNAGSADLSGYQESSGNGALSLLGATNTDPGTVDASASANGQFLYVQTGADGIVDEFHVDGNGALSEVGSVTVPGAVGGEGIVAF